MYRRVSKKEAAARRSSKMECRDHSNAANPKSLMSRGNVIVVAGFMLFAMVMAAPALAQISIVPENAKPPKKNNQIPYYEYLLNFESNLKERGFTKQIALWNLVPPTGNRSQAAYINGGDYAQVVRHLVGIWVNYQDKLVMFRTDGNVLADGQVVTFDQITETRVKVDSYEETKAQAQANTRTSIWGGANANSKTVTQEIVKSAEVTVVTKGPNGVQSYRIFVSNYDAGANPLFGTSAQAHDSKNDKAVPFIQSIVDEIDFILSEYKKE